MRWAPSPAPAPASTSTIAVSSASWQHGRAGSTLASSALTSSVKDALTVTATHYMRESRNPNLVNWVGAHQDRDRSSPRDDRRPQDPLVRDHDRDRPLCRDPGGTARRHPPGPQPGPTDERRPAGGRARHRRGPPLLRRPEQPVLLLASPGRDHRGLAGRHGLLRRDVRWCAGGRHLVLALEDPILEPARRRRARNDDRPGDRPRRQHHQRGHRGLQDQRLGIRVHQPQHIRAAQHARPAGQPLRAAHQPGALPAALEPPHAGSPGGDAGDDLSRALLRHPVLYLLCPRQHRDPGRPEAGPGDVAGRHRLDPAGDRLPAPQGAPPAPTGDHGGRGALDRERSRGLSGALAALAALEQELEKPLGLELGLFDDRLDLPLQFLPVLGGQYFRRVDEDRNPADVFVTAQRRDDFEAVDPRHDQVEDDQVWLVAQSLLDASSGIVDRNYAHVVGLEHGLDQADRLQVVIDDQDVRRHLLRPLGIRHEVESDHQLDKLLPVDRLGQNLDIRDRNRRAVEGRHDHQRDVTRAWILAQLLDQRRRAAKRQVGVDQHGQRLQVRGLLQGAGPVVDIHDFVAGALEEGLDALPRDQVVVGHQDVWRAPLALDHRRGVGTRRAAAGQRPHRFAERDRAVVQVLEILATVFGGQCVHVLVQQHAGKPNQRVEARVDQMALFRAQTGARRRHWAGSDPGPLLLPGLVQGFPDLLHLFVLGLDLGGEGQPARHPVRCQLVRLLGELGVATLQRQVLLALAGQIPFEACGVILVLDGLGEQALTVEAPLDLIRLQRVPIAGDHLELLTVAGRFRPGRLSRLPRLVAVGRRRVTIGGGLLALLPRSVQLALELRQALALGSDRFVDGPERRAQPVLFVLDGLPFGGPLTGRILMACELGPECLGHRFDAREELPPLGNGVAERAGQVRRVRHAPITAGTPEAGASALAAFRPPAFRPARALYAPPAAHARACPFARARWAALDSASARLGGDDLGPNQWTQSRGLARRVRGTAPALGRVLGEDLGTERDAEVADVDLGRAGHQADVPLLLAAKRAATHRAVHGPDYLRAFP